MEERRKRTKNTKKKRSITKNITRNIIRRGLTRQVHLTHNLVQMKVRFPLLAINAIVGQEAETGIIDQGQGLMKNVAGETILEKEEIENILVKGGETQEKEMLKLSPSHLMI
jgi:predicted ATP-dependent Lon-type protease